MVNVFKNVVGKDGNIDDKSYMTGENSLDQTIENLKTKNKITSLITGEEDLS